MKSPKTYLIVFLLAALIIPSFVNAAWWNPFSWNIWSVFFKSPTTTTTAPSQTETKTPASQQQQNALNQNNLNNQNKNISANTEPIFGTMLAFHINDVLGMARQIDAVKEGGWTQFKKDDSAYQNLKSNLKKLIQDRTKLVRTTGFSLDREIIPYFTWNVIEPQKEQFDWDLADLYTQATLNAGVKISAVIQPFAGWDQKNTKINKEAMDFAYWDYKAGPPNDLVEYQNFLTKAVERYKNQVVVWEIGNEPENPGGGYQNNPEGYFDLVKITSETIKKADPKAKVTNGGAMPVVGMRESDSFKNYWTKFFTLGGGRYIDYFNVHYNIERDQGGAKLNPAAFQEDLAFFNNLMDKNGGRKPLYLTEFGIYSGSPSSAPIGQPVQGTGQIQINSPTQPPPPGQSPNQPLLGGRCGDNICDDFEKQNPNACPQDCGGSAPSGNLGQPSGQSMQEQVPSQNIQPNQEQTMRNLSKNDQAVLYFKYSVIAFANGVRTIFIDLVGSDDNMIGSSVAFNTSGQPRLFLNTLKTIASKIRSFSDVKKFADGQYKFTVNGKSVYAFWSGKVPAEISGSVKVTDINGKERIIDAVGIKFSSDQPVFVFQQ